MSKYKYEGRLLSKEKEELHRAGKYNYDTRAVYSPSPNSIWSVDLVDMTHQPDHNYKYILNCVDVFSRKLFCRIMTKKDIPTITKSFNSIFQDAKPQNIWCDRESAIESHEMQEWFNKHDITVYHTYGNAKSCIVERLNRTMKAEIWKHSPKQWTKFVYEFMKAYNDTKHSNINLTPNEAYHTKEGQIKALETNREHYNEPKDEPKKHCKVGDRVRILASKKTFHKSYKGQWSDEIFTIDEVKPTNPTTYIIKDDTGEVIQGSFYQQELQKTAL